MSFASQFLQNFTDEDLKANMPTMLANIGDTMELALVSDVQAGLNINTDFTQMDENTIRKYLSYFYIFVRNYQAANGTTYITVQQSSTAFTIPAGTPLTSSRGLRYFNPLSVSPPINNSAFPFLAVQGSLIQSSGIYDNYIVISDTGIDLSYTTLTINGQSIPKVNAPINGFMQFYYGGKLYIKIFSGVDVQQFQGLSYVVSYVKCDGAFGNIDANDFVAFDGVLYDGNGREIIYTLTNAPINNGLSSPDIHELRSSLRYNMFTKNVLVRVSDYQNFFASQPEVGDSIVYGDYEYWLLTGILKITGLVYAVLYPKNGGHFSIVDFDIFNARIAPVKDMSFIKYLDYSSIWHYYEFHYTSSLNDTNFYNSVSQKLSTLYDPSQIADLGLSLFGTFDVTVVRDNIDFATYAPTNFSIVPFIVYRNEFMKVQANPSESDTPAFTTDDTDASWVDYVPGHIHAMQFQLNTPSNLKPGYTRYTFNPKDGVVAEVDNTAGSVTYDLANTETHTGCTLSNISPIGEILAITLKDNASNAISNSSGKGYSTAPQIVIIDDIIPVAHVVVDSLGQIQEVIIDSPGFGFSAGNVSVSFVDPTGLGYGAAVATSNPLDFSDNGGIIGFAALSSKGHNYSPLTKIVFTPSQAVVGGAGAYAVGIVNHDGSVSIQIIQPGSGYVNPKIQIIGPCGLILSAASSNAGDYTFHIPLNYIEEEAAPNDYVRLGLVTYPGLLYVIKESITGLVVGYHDYSSNLVVFYSMFPYTTYVQSSGTYGLVAFTKGEMLIFSESMERAKLITDNFTQARQLYGFDFVKI